MQLLLERASIGCASLSGGCDCKPAVKHPPRLALLLMLSGLVTSARAGSEAAMPNRATSRTAAVRAICRQAPGSVRDMQRERQG